MSKPNQDPVVSLSDEQQAARGSLWWSHPANKKARQADGDLEQSGVAKLLALSEWEDAIPFDRKSSRSLMAWRGLWVGPDLGAIEKALEQGLAPPAADPKDWWARTWFRSKSLKAVFLPTYPTPDPKAPAQTWDEYHEREQLRKRVARGIHERYPQLLTWMVDTLDSNRSVYSHPLLICAREGMEEEYDRFASVVDPRVFFSPTPSGEEQGIPDDSPSADLLEIGLRRQFTPLIDLALEFGADENSSVTDFRGAERSLLHSAIASANEPAVDWLLARAPDLERWDRMAHTPFLVAARQADIATMEKLAAAGANVHALDRFGRSAAHLVMESVRTQDLDLDQLRRFDARVYTDKTPQEIQRILTRAAQALDVVGRLGVDLSLPCGPTPKNTKKSPSPFAGLPRSNRTKRMAQPGETWEDYMSRKCSEDPLLGEKGLAWLRSVKLEAALAVVPPDPEEGEEGPPPPSASPRRPRARM